MKIEEDKEPQRDQRGFPYQRPSPRSPVVIMTARICLPGQLVKEGNVTGFSLLFIQSINRSEQREFAASCRRQNAPNHGCTGDHSLSPVVYAASKRWTTEHLFYNVVNKNVKRILVWLFYVFSRYFLLALLLVVNRAL